MDVDHGPRLEDQNGSESSPLVLVKFTPHPGRTDAQCDPLTVSLVYVGPTEATVFN